MYVHIQCFSLTVVDVQDVGHKKGSSPLSRSLMTGIV